MDDRWEAGERPGKRSVRMWLLEMPCSDIDSSSWSALGIGVVNYLAEFGQKGIASC